MFFFLLDMTLSPEVPGATTGRVRWRAKSKHSLLCYWDYVVYSLVFCLWQLELDFFCHS